MAVLPDRLGAFAIERVVGEGGSATVYAARKDGELVALKVLRADIALTDGERRRFLAEAERLARVSHDNVIRVLDSGELPDGRPYLVLPLLEGETLAARIVRAPLSREAALGYAYAAADALTALHAAGLVHRDLKPENLFVTTGDKLVLLDFGIARDPDADPSTTTKLGHIRGTPAYMAPERFFGVTASVASEVYELAATVHVLLAGTLPWPMTGDLDARLDPKIAPLIPTGMRAVLRSALATRAEARPATIEAFVAALKASESGALVEQATAELPQASQLARAAITGPDVAMAMTEPDVRRTTTDKTRASASAITTEVNRKRGRFLAGGLVAALAAAAVGVAILITRDDGVEVDTRRVVLVLAPRNESGAPEAGWLAAAIAERTKLVLAIGGDFATPDASAQQQMALDLPSPAGTADAELLKTIRTRSSAAIVVTSSYLDDADHTLHLTFLAQDTATGAVVASASATGPVGELGSLVTRAAGELRLSLGGGKLATADKPVEELQGEAAKVYADGVACLRRYETVCARANLDRAVALAPDSPLVHDALAEALHAGGDYARARSEISHAIELGRSLPETQRLAIEARSYAYTSAWPQAVATYQTLVQREPTDLSHQLGLADAQAEAGSPSEAFATLARAREHSDDPRLDLHEAEISDRANDFSREAAAADRAIAAADKLGQRGLGARARLLAGWSRVALGKLDEAKPLLDDALRAFGAEGDRNGTARAIIDLGTLLESKADLAGARKMYEDGLRLARELGNQQELATVLMDLGQVLAESGDPTSAQARYEEALGIARQLADVNLTEEVLVNLGSAASKSANIDKARGYYEEARKIATEHGHHRVLAAVLVNMSNLDEHGGDVTKAIAQATQAVAEARKTDEPGLLTASLTALAEHQAQAAMFDDSLKNFAEVEALQAKANDNAGLISTRTTRVTVMSDAGHNVEADKLAIDTLAEVDAKADPTDFGWLNLQLARTAYDQQQWDRCDKFQRLAATVIDTAGDAEMTAEVRILAAGLLAARGHLAEAQAALAKVRELAVTSGQDNIVRQSDVWSAQLALQFGHDKSARAKLEALAKDARAHGAVAVARKAEDALKE